MKALILNSGLGSRMGDITSEHPKCMTQISVGETILSRQLKQLEDFGILDVVITTGKHQDALIEYVNDLGLNIHPEFVYNPLFESTNYIYSIYCARDYLDDDIVLMHGDLVFENEVLERLLQTKESKMVVSSKIELPQKDFKAVIEREKITAVGIEFFKNALAAQPLYFLKRTDFKLWLDEIGAFCKRGERNVYAENALNSLDGKIDLKPLDIEELLCREIDDINDLNSVSKELKKVEQRTVYMSFSADVIHGGHISIIKKAARLGKLTIGVLTDEAVSSYKRYPLNPETERFELLSNIKGVSAVVYQKELSYKNILMELKPDIVVHGSDWREGVQAPVREEVVEILKSYGGRLIEFEYSDSKKYKEIEANARRELSLPDIRRGRLKRSLEMKGFVNAIEAHSGITGLIAEQTVVYDNGEAHQFDAMWLSSLCDSTAKGKPDIELVDLSSRLRTVEDIMEVTTKPIIFDGDTGGQIEHFVYTVRTLERVGVSMVIVEDKTGLKKNSLFGVEVEQTQDSIENFCAKISAGKKAQKSNDFMICARIESLILEKGMEDAIKRANAYVEAGADAVMIHSRKKCPDEIFEFLKLFRESDLLTPVVLVPTSYNQITEEEFKKRGANIVIYANQLTRTGFPAMKEAAVSILTHRRALECDSKCMSIKDIITLIPEE
ncbi:MAG: phosphoenolpyruvate mutase [Lachnospiraceae bacterium]|nr:phosphoenolpyruvate mutase [Lachnospiraceae bacterium]